MGIGWDHERCMGPLRAAARAWHEQGRGEVVWETRTLRDFGDQPLEELAGDFDLLSIDHPFVGTAHLTGCLTPLDTLLPEDSLAAFAADAIGESHASYTYAGHQWALATDAACQVAAVRDDLLAFVTAPRTWDEVLELARAEPGRVALPLLPADAISCFLTLCANAGAPPPFSDSVFAESGAARYALELLRELAALAHPESIAWNPPWALDRMTETDEVVYIPLAYGYSGYSCPGGRPRPCRFLDIPSAGPEPLGAMLGGSGLAVSSSSSASEEAAAFAAWLQAPEAQLEVVGRASGQPGSRSAWEDADLDRASGGFLSGTRRTLEAAYMRPREPWWPWLQLAAGEAIHDWLRSGGEVDTAAARIEELYREARAGARTTP
jgi:multiple sugar transport system substrate-binding protein